MQISKNTVVSFHYVLNDKAGEQLESSRDGEPTSYLHGAGNIIRGLEAALKDHSAGDTLSV